MLHSIPVMQLKSLRSVLRNFSHMTHSSCPSNRSVQAPTCIASSHRHSCLHQMRSFSVSTMSSQFFCERLHHRRLLKMTGQDTHVFLQGLITNDIRYLEDPNNSPALYSMVLNSQGRVLYDVLLYKIESDEPSILLECDSSISSQVLSIFEKHKLRKKVKLSDVGDELYISAVFTKDLKSAETDLPSLKFCDKAKVLFHSVDPRVKGFGYRLVTSSDVKGDVVDSCEKVEDAYHVNRYKIGLSEGPVDLPPGHCLPLESNLEFLNGVTFDKGCYVGQELTARTHHTGVIRKRLMPVALSSIKAAVKTDATVETSAGKACGKVRNVIGKYGLALLRLEEVLGEEQLVIKDEEKVIAEATTFIPSWWNVDSDEILKQIIAKRLRKDDAKQD